MHQDIEKLLNAAKEKGSITEKQREIILSKAEKLGEDISEVEFLLEDIPMKNGTKEKLHMKQCPNCGKMVADNTLKCPDCGYEFQIIEANKSIKELFSLLNEDDSHDSNAEMLNGIMGKFVIDKNTRKNKIIIENFPIPNAKTDLIEFITVLKPKAIDTSDKLAISYYKKYEECINKVKALYPKDTDILPLLSEYDNVRKVAKKIIHENKSFDTFKWFLIFMVAFMILIKLLSL